MNGYRITISGDPDNWVYALAESPEEARTKSLRWWREIECESEDLASIVVERAPRIDGDDLNDRDLWHSGDCWVECRSCYRRIHAQCDPSDDDISPVFDAEGYAYCSETCLNAPPRNPRSPRVPDDSILIMVDY